MSTSAGSTGHDDAARNDRFDGRDDEGVRRGSRLADRDRDAVVAREEEE